MTSPGHSRCCFVTTDRLKPLLAGAPAVGKTMGTHLWPLWCFRFWGLWTSLMDICFSARDSYGNNDKEEGKSLPFLVLYDGDTGPSCWFHDSIFSPGDFPLRGRSRSKSKDPLRFPAVDLDGLSVDACTVRSWNIGAHWIYESAQMGSPSPILLEKMGFIVQQKTTSRGKNTFAGSHANTRWAVLKLLAERSMQREAILPTFVPCPVVHRTMCWVVREGRKRPLLIFVMHSFRPQTTGISRNGHQKEMVLCCR